jgi:hypothetical protein
MHTAPPTPSIPSCDYSQNSRLFAYLSSGFPFGITPALETYKYKDHSTLALRALEHKLNNPWELDEGDLFAVALLAMPVHIIGPDEFVRHMEEFATIMKHLSRRKRAEHQLNVFWPLIRDEMIMFGIEYHFAFGTKPIFVTSIEPEQMGSRLVQACHDPISYQAFHERQEYQRRLGLATISGYSSNGFHKTTTQQLVLLESGLALVHNGNRADPTGVIMSIIMEVRANLHPIEGEQVLESFVAQMVKIRETKEGNLGPFLVEGAVGLLRFLLSGLLMEVLMTQLNQELGPEMPTKVAAKLMELTSFVLRVYRIAYPFFNARSGTMTNSAITRAETALGKSYKHRKPLLTLF